MGLLNGYWFFWGYVCFFRFSAISFSIASLARNASHFSRSLAISSGHIIRAIPLMMCSLFPFLQTRWPPSLMCMSQGFWSKQRHSISTRCFGIGFSRLDISWPPAMIHLIVFAYNCCVC